MGVIKLHLKCTIYHASQLHFDPFAYTGGQRFEIIQIFFSSLKEKKYLMLTKSALFEQKYSKNYIVKFYCNLK